MQCTIDVQSLLHVETSFPSHFLELEISKVCMEQGPVYVSYSTLWVNSVVIAVPEYVKTLMYTRSLSVAYPS